MAELSLEQQRAIAIAEASLKLKQQPIAGSPQDIQRNILADMPGNPSLEEAKPISTMGRVGYGLSRPVWGAAQLMANAPGIGHPTTAKSIGDKLARDEQIYKTRRSLSGDTGVDFARGTGEFVGSLPVTMAMPGASSGAGQGFRAAVGSGALQGAAVEATAPVTDTSRPYWSQKGTRMAIGAATGGATSGAANRVGAFINPEVTPNVRYLRERGVQPTPGQLTGFGKAEDAFSSVNPAIAYGQRRAMEQFNRAAYNEVLEPLGMTYQGPVGKNGIREVGDALSNAYENLVPNLRVVPDAEFAADLTAATQIAQEMSDDAARQFQRILERQLPNGRLEQQSLRAVQSKLTQEISRFGRSQDPNHQMIAEGLEAVQDAISSNLQRVNPDHAAQLGAINQGWSRLVRLERAALNTSDGVFTPGQLQTAIRTTDDSVRKRAVSRGQSGAMGQLADAGADVLGNRYPDSGTPGRVLAGSLALGGAGMLAGPGTAAGVASTALAYTPRGQGAINWLLTNPKLGGASAPARQLVEQMAPIAAAPMIFGTRPTPERR